MAHSSVLAFLFAPEPSPGLGTNLPYQGRVFTHLIAELLVPADDQRVGRLDAAQSHLEAAANLGRSTATGRTRPDDRSGLRSFRGRSSSSGEAYCLRCSWPCFALPAVPSQRPRGSPLHTAPRRSRLSSSALRLEEIVGDIE